MPTQSRFARALCALALVSAAVGVTPARADEDASDSNEARKTQPLPAPIIVNGFTRPESVLHDEERDVYLVSNITNGPREADNSGFISRLAPNGTVLALKWIQGGVGGVTLNAPKGTAIVGNTLYVADIDFIRLFDVTTGAPTGNILVPSATFLNDVTVDKKGNVYVSDIGFTTVPVFGESGTDAIWKLAPTGVLSRIASGNSLLNHPNGLAIDRKGDLVVANYDPFRNTKDLYKIEKDGQVKSIATLPTGLLDGVVVLKKGYLVSSWVDFSNVNAGIIYFVSSKGKVKIVSRGYQNPSDIGYDAKRNRVLIPELPEPGDGGRVIIQPLGKD